MLNPLPLKNPYWDWKLLGVIFAYMAFPALYLSYRMYLIGNGIPDANGLAIDSQWQFVQVLYEIVQESLVLPIFYFVGSTLHRDKPELTARRAAGSLWVIFLLVLPLTIAFSFFAERFVEVIDTPGEIVRETIGYLRIRSWSLVTLALSLGAVIMMEALKLRGALVRLLGFRLALSLAADSYLFGGYSFSLPLGIEGVALSSLVVETGVFTLAIYELHRYFGPGFTRSLLRATRGDLAVFGRIGAWVAVDSAVRNVAYLAVIVNLTNAMGTESIGAYYLCMFLFWTILLVPIQAIAETSSVLFANHADSPGQLRNILRFALILGAVTLLGWTVVAVFVGRILAFFGNATGSIPLAITSFYWLLGPYALLALNTIADSLFLGLGRTKYLAFQSLITNGTVYLTAYVLYVQGIWIPDLQSVLTVFGLGILVDTVLTYAFARRVLKELAGVPTAP